MIQIEERTRYIFLNSSLVVREHFIFIHFHVTGVTSVEADWLPLFVPSMCRNQVPLSQSDNTVTPRYDNERGLVVRHVTSSFGEFDTILT